MRALCRSALLPLALLAGCAPPPPPPPTIVQLTLAAAPDVNPDAAGRPAPVTVKVYQLGATGAFERLDFFQLYGKEQAALGADLAGEDQATLAPGQSQVLTVLLKPNATAIGVLAAYRDIDHARWRADTTPPANKTTKLTATVGRLAVTLGGP